MPGALKAQTNSTPPLSVDQITGGTRSTPGNVGVCLSGGGSRACSAGMGQLRALQHLQANGASLLSQVKAISTVSGGSWLGVPFTFLPDSVSDEDYLNKYVADPGRLVATNGPSIDVTLDQLPPGNIGAALDSRRFSIPAIAVQAFLLWKFKKTPANMLWQTVIGMHLLKPYGLHKSADNGLPTSFFSADQTTLSRITQDNPSLAQESAHVIAKGPNHVTRPYLICNTSMFVDFPGGLGQPGLVPVQATPFFTGVVSSPNATDANGKLVGGGGVTSFAFDSVLAAVDGSAVGVVQDRQWSLTDIVGASSAAFGGELEQILSDPKILLEHLLEHFEEGVNWLMEHLGFDPPFDLSAETPEFLKKALILPLVDDFDVNAGGIIPEYGYWPVRDASPDPAAKPSRFADGGNLENTGICAMLSYSDIDSIIAFVNSPTPMVQTPHGVIDADGNRVPGTEILVDGQLPPLFGYHAYDKHKGYSLMTDSDVGFDSRSRVFPPEAFVDLLKALWENSGNLENPGSNAQPAICSQTLEIVDNEWFGVVGGRSIQVVWMYLNDVTDWRSQLSSDVQSLVGSTKDFPNFKTLHTNLSAKEINLLASMTAWSVGNPDNSSAFTSLFHPPS